MTKLSATKEMGKSGSKEYGTITVQLPHDHECDVHLVFPNGEIAALQYRLESPSIDLCFQRPLQVTNWKDDDLTPATPKRGKGGGAHVHDVQQLCIDFPPTWLEPKEGETAPVMLDITPNFTPEQTKKVEAAIDAKNHAGYVCYLMLRRLNRAVGLQTLVREKVRRGELEQEIYDEFFGDVKAKPEEAGCSEAEGYTIPGLLDHWEQTQEAMLKAISGR